MDDLSGGRGVTERGERRSRRARSPRRASPIGASHDGSLRYRFSSDSGLCVTSAESVASASKEQPGAYPPYWPGGIRDGSTSSRRRAPKPREIRGIVKASRGAAER